MTKNRQAVEPAHQPRGLKRGTKQRLTEKEIRDIADAPERVCAEPASDGPVTRAAKRMGILPPDGPTSPVPASDEAAERLARIHKDWAPTQGLAAAESDKAASAELRHDIKAFLAEVAKP